MKKTIIALLLFVFQIDQAKAWLFAPSDEGECVRKYVSKIPDADTAQLVAMTCLMYFRNTDKISKKFAECFITDASQSKNYAATQVIFVNCHDKYPLNKK